MTKIKVKINQKSRLSTPVICVAEDDAKHHLTDAKDHRDFHLERVEKRDLVSGRLPHLTHTTQGRGTT